MKLTKKSPVYELDWDIEKAKEGNFIIIFIYQVNKYARLSETNDLEIKVKESVFADWCEESELTTVSYRTWWWVDVEDEDNVFSYSEMRDDLICKDNLIDFVKQFFIINIIQ